LDVYDIKSENSVREGLFVLPIFVRSGKLNMMFQYIDKSMGLSSEWTLDRAISEYRLEDICHFHKVMKSHIHVRKFVKDESVFKDWYVDDLTALKKVLEYDM
jgi:hypothetical protein